MTENTQLDAPAVFVVKTERLDGEVYLKTEYRIIARSVVEAAEIVAESCIGVEEIIREIYYATHITGLPTNRFKIVPVENEEAR